MEQNLASLYVGLKTLLQVFERRRYRNMVINMCGQSTPCLPTSLSDFVEWTTQAVNSKHIPALRVLEQEQACQVQVEASQLGASKQQEHPCQVQVEASQLGASKQQVQVEARQLGASKQQEQASKEHQKASKQQEQERQASQAKAKRSKQVSKDVQEEDFRLYLTGATWDLAKCVHAEFAMTSILFGDKKTGVALMRSTLDRLVASRLSDTVTIEQTTPDKQTRLVSAPRACEACIVHVGSEHGATSDALKYLADLKREHASHLTVTELTMSQHLRANLLDHPLVPRMVRMSAEESNKIKLKEPHVLNMLPSSDVPVLLLGGLAGDIIVKYDDLKTGVVAKTFFRVVDIDPKSNNKTNT
jgi:hypothetical protein